MIAEKQESDYQRLSKAAAITFLCGAAIVFVVLFTYCGVTENLLAISIFGCGIVVISVIAYMLFRKSWG